MMLSNHTVAYPLQPAGTSIKKVTGSWRETGKVTKLCQTLKTENNLQLVSKS